MLVFLSSKIGWILFTGPSTYFGGAAIKIKFSLFPRKNETSGRVAEKTADDIHSVVAF
jgi:hypothetical protein